MDLVRISYAVASSAEVEATRTEGKENLKLERWLSNEALAD